MASTKSISAAIKSVDAKKLNLRKAFEDLQSHSSFLASFTFQWKDLEEHFDSIQKSIEERFEELESKEKQSAEESKSLDKPNSPAKEPAKKSKESELIARPELKSLCEKMDGMGLRSFIMNHRKELTSIRDEVGVALQSASDPAKLVLDAMQGFYPPKSKGDKDGELAAIRRTCILLLEQLMSISPQIKPPVKEKAKKLAVEWKGKVSTGGENPLEALAFLQLLATFGLGSAFNADELLDLVFSVARRKQVIDLCRVLGFAEKIPDFIEKLSSNGKQLEAVKFVYAFELVDKFPPVPLLKAYLKQSKKVAQEIRKKGNVSVQSQNEATAKEIAAVRAIIKCIEDHKLESLYPRENLDKRVEQLEKQKANRKRHAAAPVPVQNLQQQQHSGNKRPRPAAPTTVATPPTFPPTSQVHLQQPGGLLPERLTPYLSSSAQYGLVGPTPASQYMSSASGSYGLGPNLSYGVNLSPTRSHLYSSESHMTTGLYDRSMGLSGYGLPPSYRQSFYH